ncbi:Uncharacterized protein%2C possibly involved in aromatic compounds catabolism [Mycobacterium tuberculosis]|nr:Uncharacterized protein%2C possibly involved in aromatic compounds catabolism [Mycobacterium tuberculosis]
MSDPLTAQEQHKRRQAVRELMPRTPFIGGLGIVFERYEPDDVVIRLPFRTDLTNDGTYFHGGVIASVMDPPVPPPLGRTTTSTGAPAPPRSR